MSVGENIRKRRLASGMTMTELAEQVGVTIGGLSQIERDLVNPTLPTLRRIAAALNAPVFSFLMENDTAEQIVVRHGRHRVYGSPDHNAAYESLSPKTLQRFEVVRFSLEPGACTADDAVAHTGEEFVVVLNGSIRADVGPQQYSLADGDSIKFDSSIPHKYTNVGETHADLIGVMSPRWS